MSRITAALLMAGLVAMAAGCRMCASTHDTCPPTCTGHHGEHSPATARAGSILSGNVAPFPSDGLLRDQTPEHEADGSLNVQIPYDEEIASGVILSVTDRKLEEAEVAQDDLEGIELNQAAVEGVELRQAEVPKAPQDHTRLADKGRSVPSKGWTAAKRTETRMQ